MIDGEESDLEQELRICCHHNVEHRQDIVKDEVQWLNLKQETRYYAGRFELTGRKYAFLGRRARADKFGKVLFCLILSSSLWEVRPTYRLFQWHEKLINHVALL